MDQFIILWNNTRRIVIGSNTTGLKQINFLRYIFFMWRKKISDPPILANNKHIILPPNKPSPLYIIAHRINIKMNYLLNSSMLKNTYSPLSIMLSSSAANSISLTVNGLAHTTITETERITEISPWLKIRFRTYVYNEMLLLLSRRVVVHYYWKT